MTEKKNIDVESIKNKDVFKVPENYFETITSRVMDRIDSEDKKIISINDRKQQKPWLKWTSVAACITLVFAGTAFLSKYIDNSADNTAAISTEEYMSQEDIIEYTMLDREDIYCYLAGDEY